MRAAPVVALLGLLLEASPARADDPPRGSPYRLKLAYDASIIGLGAAGSMTSFVGHPKAACHPGCVPPPGTLGIDDWAIGNYSPPAHSLANVVVAGLVAAPLLFDAADTRFDGWAEDTVVFLESLLVAQALTQLSKSAVGRTAPFVYNPRAEQQDLDSPDAFRSFVSGHSSTSFAAATAYAVTFWKRHPTSPLRFVVLGVGEALALGVGMLKVKAGYHYPTDIAGGALVGASVGLLVPMLHSDW